MMALYLVVLCATLLVVMAVASAGANDCRDGELPSAGV